jgi:hypothetical protein
MGAVACLLMIGGRRHRLLSNMPLKPVYYYDLNGYAGPQGDKFKPWMAFDAHGYVDPKNGVTTFPAGHRGDSTQFIPEKMNSAYEPIGWMNVGGNDSIYYPGRRGNRIVFDMTGARDRNDITNRVTLTDIYGYRFSWDAGDTLFFYNLDAMLGVAVEERWKFLARPDSAMTPFAYLIGTNTGGTGQWQSTSASVTVRYIMVVAHFKNRGNYTTIPDFRELCLYGDYTYTPANLDRRPDTYTGPIHYTTNTMGQFAGTNLGNGYDTLQLGNEGLVRVYGSTSYWDNNAVGTSLASTTYTFDYFPDIGPVQYPYFVRTNKMMWWSIKGARSSLGLHTNQNTDVKMGDPENPFNYYFSGQLYYNYAAKWGRVAVPADSTKWTGDSGYPNGQNKIHWVENGNEPLYSYSQLSYVAQSLGDYDGYESRFGHRFGVKNADSTFGLIMAGLTDLDTATIDNMSWYCHVLRTDQRFIWDAINFHHYPRTKVNQYNYAPGSDEQVGVSGASPESDGGIGIKAWYQAVTRACIKSSDNTHIKILCTEYGYSNYGHPATTANQAAFPWDMGNCPSRGIYDSTQVKAYLQGRSEIIMPFTGFYGYNEYFFHNADGSTNISFMLFQSDGRVTLRNISSPFNAQVYYASWYYLAGQRRALWNYYPEKVLFANDTTHAWIVKWRNIYYPDSTCICYWNPTQTGAVISSASIPLGNVIGSVKKKTPSFVHEYCDSSTVSATAGNYAATNIPETGTMLFFKELLLVPIQPIYKPILIRRS